MFHVFFTTVGQACNQNRSPNSKERRKAVVILGVLVLIVILSLLSYRYLDLMTQEYRAANNVVKAAQARALAESGVWYTAMALSNPKSYNGLLGGNPFNNAGAFHQQLVLESPDGVGNGYFSVLAGPAVDKAQSSGQSFTFGVLDEGGKINLNAWMKLDPTGNKLNKLLLNLPNMNEGLAAKIVDWLDLDSEVRQGGAENSNYQGMDPPYSAKNGPLDSLDELLLVEGMTPELLFGSDFNRNGMIDPDETVADPQNPLGLSGYLTIYSREQNIYQPTQGGSTTSYLPRVNVNQGPLTTLKQKLDQTGLDQKLTTYILLYRYYGGETVPSSTSSSSSSSSSTSSAGKSSTGTNSSTTKTAEPVVATSLPTEVDLAKIKKTTRIKSLMDLVGTQVKVPAKDSKDPTKVFLSPLNDTAGQETLLPQLWDKTTTSKSTDLPARININTAPAAVLRALTGVSQGNNSSTEKDPKMILTEEEVDTIISSRPELGSSNFNSETFNTPAWLVTQAKLKPTTVKNLESYVTTRSQVYRFQVVGYFDTAGPSARFEAVIDTNAGRPRILLFRDLTLLGKGFDLSQMK